MAITKVTPNMIQVANNVTSNTFGSATQIPQITFDSNGVITAASNVSVSIPEAGFNAFLLAGM
jgi:hypothetical protein